MGAHYYCFLFVLREPSFAKQRFGLTRLQRQLLFLAAYFRNQLLVVMAETASTKTTREQTNFSLQKPLSSSSNALHCQVEQKINNKNRPGLNTWRSRHRLLDRIRPLKHIQSAELAGEFSLAIAASANVNIFNLYQSDNLSCCVCFQ